MPPVERQRILKADAARQLGTRVAFNYEDFRARCDQHLAEVRAQADRILNEAREEAGRIREATHAEVVATARAEGMRNADEEIERRAAERVGQAVTEQLSHVVPALRTAVDELVRERDDWLEVWESGVVRLAVAIAEKLIHRRLELQPEMAFESAAAALELAVGSPQVELRMHPLDIELVEQQGQALLDVLRSCGESRLTADESIARGGCIVRTTHGTIDAALDTQLERIADELLQRDI